MIHIWTTSNIKVTFYFEQPAKITLVRLIIIKVKSLLNFTKHNLKEAFCQCNCGLLQCWIIMFYNMGQRSSSNGFFYDIDLKIVICA